MLLFPRSRHMLLLSVLVVFFITALLFGHGKAIEVTEENKEQIEDAKKLFRKLGRTMKKHRLSEFTYKYASNRAEAGNKVPIEKADVTEVAAIEKLQRSGREYIRLAAGDSGMTLMYTLDSKEDTYNFSAGSYSNYFHGNSAYSFPPLPEPEFTPMQAEREALKYTRLLGFDRWLESDEYRIRKVRRDAAGIWTVAWTRYYGQYPYKRSYPIRDHVILKFHEKYGFLACSGLATRARPPQNTKVNITRNEAVHKAYEGYTKLYKAMRGPDEKYYVTSLLACRKVIVRTGTPPLQVFLQNAQEKKEKKLHWKDSARTHLTWQVAFGIQSANTSDNGTTDAEKGKKEKAKREHYSYPTPVVVVYIATDDGELVCVGGADSYESFAKDAFEERARLFK